MMLLTIWPRTYLGEAEGLYRAAIDAGEIPALTGLAMLLRKAGRYEETNASYRAAIKAGDRNSLVMLGAALLAEPGGEGAGQSSIAPGKPHRRRPRRRSQPVFEAAVIGLDPVVRVLLDVVPCRRDQAVKHAREDRPCR